MKHLYPIAFFLLLFTALSAQEDSTLFPVFQPSWEQNTDETQPKTIDSRIPVSLQDRFFLKPPPEGITLSPYEDPDYNKMMMARSEYFITTERFNRPEIISNYQCAEFRPKEYLIFIEQPAVDISIKESPKTFTPSWNPGNFSTLFNYFDQTFFPCRDTSIVWFPILKPSETPEGYKILPPFFQEQNLMVHPFKPNVVPVVEEELFEKLWASRDKELWEKLEGRLVKMEQGVFCVWELSD